jgi:hypothetical protein
VQAAIWTLLGTPFNINGGDLDNQGPVSQANVDAIVALAKANGEGFVADTTQFQAVIFAPTDADGHVNTLQPIIGQMLAAGLGDFVFEDNNANGIQEAGELGIAGVTVELVRNFDVNKDGIVEDDEFLVLDTTTTDNTGFYEFLGLTPGLDYQVRFSTPEGFDSVSPRQVGDDSTVDSDGLLSDVVVLKPGEFNPTIDSGFFKFAGLGDFVFEDTNTDGIQDEGEEGIDGVTVKLLADLDGDGAIDDVVDTTITGDNPNTPGVVEKGYYEFTGLTPGVEYKVMFTQPDGFDGVSPFQAGDDPTVDSDANPDDGLMSDVVVLTSGEFDSTIDAGFFQEVVVELAGLGDFVFNDLDRDGIQDDGEVGIDGATVKLLDANGTVIRTTTTGDNPDTGVVEQGYYEFTS